MTERTTCPGGHFAAMLTRAMDQFDLGIGELSKQLGISLQHARRLQAGEVLPRRLLWEKIAVATGVPVNELQVAIKRDRMSRNFGSKTGAHTADRSKRIRLFEPLINALDCEQIPAAYAMLENLTKEAKSKQPPAKSKRLSSTKGVSEDLLRQKKKEKKKAGAA